MTEQNTIPEAVSESAGRTAKWASFVETTVVDFFGDAKLEKMTLEDGNGNKAKLSRTKDNGIKIEHTSTTLI